MIVGLNRWTYRVGVYGLLMTDVYPPFRYDGGGSEHLGPHAAGARSAADRVGPTGTGAVLPPPSAPTVPPRQEQVQS